MLRDTVNAPYHDTIICKDVRFEVPTSDFEDYCLLGCVVIWSDT
jgi:hypothetical protein